MNADFTILMEEARKVAVPQRSSDSCSSGTVGAAVRSDSGAVFTGVCIDMACGIGFCAEHAAIAEMLKHGQSRIQALAAVTGDGEVLAPCGRCREMMYQLHPSNLDALILLPGDRSATLRELLPEAWSYANS